MVALDRMDFNWAMKRYKECQRRLYSKEKNPPGRFITGQRRAAKRIWEATEFEVPQLTCHMPIILGSVREENQNSNSDKHEQQPAHLKRTVPLCDNHPNGQDERTEQDEGCLITGGNFVKIEHEHERNEGNKKHIGRQPPLP